MSNDRGQAKDRRRRNSTSAPVRGLTIRGGGEEATQVSQTQNVGSNPTLPSTIRGTHTPSHGPLLVFLLLASGAAVSCSSGKVLNSANNYAFHTSRFNESCINPAPGCACRHEALARWRVALDEARDAVRRGGKYPLQLRALKEAEAKLGACPK